jgi:hypothetical protein
MKLMTISYKLSLQSRSVFFQCGYFNCILFTKKKVGRTAGYVDIRLSLGDTDSDVQAPASQPDPTTVRTTLTGRVAKPSRKAREIALAETEDLESSQKTAKRRKHISSNDTPIARTFSLEPEH